VDWVRIRRFVSPEPIAALNLGTPTITQQPSSLIVAQGATATFNISAIGDPPLGYQWRFNGSPIDGATSVSYSVLGATVANAGTYDAVVSNGSGSTTSTAAQLTVLVPPTITSQPGNQTVGAGSTVNFQVSAAGSSPLSYQWWFNGSNTLGESSDTLTLPNVQPGQAGGYSVVVANLAGTTTSSVATLTVGLPPSITQQPSSVTVIEGHDATFSLASSGDRPLDYQWRFDDAPVNSGTDSSYTVAGAMAASAGAYDVVVSNAYGSVTSLVAVLTVLVPPSITTQPTNQTVVAGANLSFQASVAGSSPMSYQWFFYSKPIPGATADTLSISNAQTIEAGTYALLITNTAGATTSSNAYLKVLVPPTLAAPEAVGSGISVPVPSVAGLSYLLEYKNDLQDPVWTAVSSWLPGTGDILVLQDTNVLSAPRFYRVRCH
jgi:hypothetical protein